MKMFFVNHESGSQEVVSNIKGSRFEDLTDKTHIFEVVCYGDIIKTRKVR